MVNSKSYLSTTAVDRIIELSWQPVNWILVKPGEGGGLWTQIGGGTTLTTYAKNEKCAIFRIDTDTGVLWQETSYLQKRWFHKTQANRMQQSEIPCFSPVLVVTDNSFPRNRWMQVIKPAFITFSFKTQTSNLYTVRFNSSHFSFLIF